MTQALALVRGFRSHASAPFKGAPVEPETIHYTDSSPSQGSNRLPPIGANYSGGLGAYGAVYAVYDGETRQGEMGPAVAYLKDIYLLRVRSKQLYIESPICHLVLNRYAQWVIGDGLELDAEPKEDVLKQEGVALDTETFNDTMESRWKVYANSNLCDYKGTKNLNALSTEAFLEGKRAGDILVVLRVIDGLVKVQHIDGDHVGNPPNCTIDYQNKTLDYQGNQGFDYIYPETNNRIRLGVEIDAQGKAVAYHVKVGMGLDFKRVKARDSKGFLRAYMYYGFKPDLDATRGTPLLSVVMETAKKLERYNSAALAGAEQRAKFAVFFEHDANSEEENPMDGVRARTLINMPTPDGALATDTAVDAQCEKIASDVSVTMNSTFMNLPKGVKANSLESKQEIHVGEFSMFHVDLICATVNMPPNVAMSKFEDSFSASRMAGKDWEHTCVVERNDFSPQYIDPIYVLQMYIWVLANKIQAPGYLQFLSSRNQIGVAAYQHARWTGDPFPDIDPVKTANAVRIMLGEGNAYKPLITGEKAAEMLGQGEFKAIIKQTKKENELLASSAILPPPDPAEAGTEEPPTDSGNKTKPKKKKVVPKKKD